MTKAEKDIYDFTKKRMKEHNITPFGTSIFNYIGSAFPKAKMENVLNVVNQLKDDELESNKQYLIRLMSFKESEETKW